MLSNSLAQAWSPSPTQSSAQVIEDGQQPQPQQDDPGNETLVFEKKWVVTDDVGGEGAFSFVLSTSPAFSLTLI